MKCVKWGECRSIDGHWAVDAFRRLVEAEPTSCETWRKLGDLHVMLGDIAMAAMHYRNGTLLAPDDARLHQNLGSALGTGHQGRHGGLAVRECGGEDIGQLRVAASGEKGFHEQPARPRVAGPEA